MTPDHFFQRLPYSPDPFQIEAVQELADGNNVLVCAPTGAGKTVIARYGLHRALSSEARAFYTTPLKALSNQKFRELRAEFGDEMVGLLTGDVVMQGDAPIVVMTTEVLRNMLYARGGVIPNLACVVLDEVHFLADPQRGPVWEEVIVHLPPHTQLVGLSATIANARELADWISSVHGDTHLVESAERPVPLLHEYAVGVRHGDLYRAPLFRGNKPNHELLREMERLRISRRARPPRRIALLEDLAEEDQLPGIVFIFSRQGCDDAVRQCVDEQFQLTSREASEHAIALFDTAVQSLTSRDQHALGLAEVRRGFVRGIAAHHAGQVPPIKEAIEQGFADGALQLVFATETLALGINMPARTVVLERLSRYTSAGHARLSSSEFIQIGGRAGRRGLDTEGRVIVAHSPWVEPSAVVALASAGPQPVESAFRPTYHMTANLVRHWTRADAAATLERSFAAFHRERSRTQLEAALSLARRQLHEIPEVRPSSAASGRKHSERLGPGVVVRLDNDSVAVLVGEDRGRHLAIDQHARLIRLRDDMHTLGRIELPKGHAPRKMGYRQRVASRLRNARFTEKQAPARAAAEERKTSIRDPKRRSLESRIAHLTHLLAAEAPLLEDFERVISLLTERSFIHQWSLTPIGNLLADTTANRDLVIVEATPLLERATDPADLASLISGLVYEARRESIHPATLHGTTASSLAESLAALGSDLNAHEEKAGLPLTEPPDFSMASAIQEWAHGASFSDVVDQEFTSGGDLVRHIRQVLDVLNQIRHFSPTLGTAARQAAIALDRGVVEASYLVGI